MAKLIDVTGPEIRCFPHLLLVFVPFMETWTSAERSFSLGHFFLGKFTSELAGAPCEFTSQPVTAAGVAQSEKKGKVLEKNIPENWVPFLLRHSEKPFWLLVQSDILFWFYLDAIRQCYRAQSPKQASFFTPNKKSNLIKSDVVGFFSPSASWLAKKKKQFQQNQNQIVVRYVHLRNCLRLGSLLFAQFWYMYKFFITTVLGCPHNLPISFPAWNNTPYFEKSTEWRQVKRYSEMGSTQKASSQDGLRSTLTKWGYYYCHKPPRVTWQRLIPGPVIPGWGRGQWWRTCITTDLARTLLTLSLLGTGMKVPCRSCHNHRCVFTV